MTVVDHCCEDHVPVAVVAGGPVGRNQRTIEILRALGLAEQVRAAAAPASTVAGTGWCTSFAGPTPLHGREIAVRDAWGGGAYAEEYAAASPASYTMRPQIRLEPLLRETAEQHPEASIRFGCPVTALVADVDGVDLTVGQGAEEARVRADYVIGADGGRPVAEALGRMLPPATVPTGERTT